MSVHLFFVCTGNVCRSPMAEGIARHLAAVAGVDVVVSSAGTTASANEPASSEAVAVCREIGVDLSAHRSQPISAELVRAADHIFVMEHNHAEWIREFYPEAAEKVLLLGVLAGGAEIDDPYGAWFRSTYRKTRNRIEIAVSAFMQRLKG